MEIIKRDKYITVKDFGSFDLGLSADCGQAFRWEKLPDGSFFGIADSRETRVKKEEDKQEEVPVKENKRNDDSEDDGNDSSENDDDLDFLEKTEESDDTSIFNQENQIEEQKDFLNRLLESKGYITTIEKKGVYVCYKKDDDKALIKDKIKKDIRAYKQSNLTKDELIELIEEVYHD